MILLNTVDLTWSDYYNVLTDPDNHHYVAGNEVQHIITGNPANSSHPDELYYYTGTDNHPTSAGHQKATSEFVPLLNAYYNIWQGNLIKKSFSEHFF